MTNAYIPKKPEIKKYEWYKDDLLMYFDDLKYDKFIEDTDKSFSCANIINFDLIHHQCCGDELQYS